MEINKKYLNKYLHLVAIEQLRDEYLLKGYNVNTDFKVGNYHADIVASKENEKIIIEVKTGKLSNESKIRLGGLADYVKEHGGYKFLIIAVTPPREKIISIENLEQLLINEFIYELPSELDMLSTHTRPDEIKDIQLLEVDIKGKQINVQGRGAISVELQYGSDGDQLRGDGAKMYDNFPFHFDLTLEYNKRDELQITDVKTLEIDTSHYYE